MAAKITVLLVDDHPMVREGLRAMLSGAPGIDVVGEASSGEEALQKVMEVGPSVVLMDIRMPGMGGTEAVRQVKKVRPATAVIMVTMYESEMYVVEAIRAGAAGYLTKDASREQLCNAIRAVMGGGTLMRSGLLRQAVEGLFPTAGGSQEREGMSGASRLSAREREVLGFLARGYGNRAICGELHLAEITVKKHVQNVMSKLGVSDRTNAAIVGVRLGFAEQAAFP
ncbi:MAG: response regulator transcription factor [Chloroflexi bacterium]|nr:response regulator transcription factor [Chloroflexota bacterium]